MVLLSAFSPVVSAETVSGNGYSVEQTITPADGALVGNGYQLNQTMQPLGGFFLAGGFTLSSGVGSPAPTSAVAQEQNIGRSNGGGFYYLPPEITGDWATSTTTQTSSTSQVEAQSTKPGTIITTNGSSCTTRVTFSSPIDVMLDNNSVDVKKLERFLNEYEGETLLVNGIYETSDIEAVKRWQLKYRTFILDPMRLKQPTGTISVLSQRQIERQSTAACGQAIPVVTCPFFKVNVKYGSRGEEVKRVQQFLNIAQKENLPLSGVFGPLTKEAVKRFQRSYHIYVTTFIPFSMATGNWYTTTRQKANETIGCGILN